MNVVQEVVTEGSTVKVAVERTVAVAMVVEGVCGGMAGHIRDGMTVVCQDLDKEESEEISV